PLPGRTLRPTPAMGVAKGAGATPHRGMQLVENREMWTQFRAVQVPVDDTEKLFAELDSAALPNEGSQMLDELATLAEHASRDGRTHVLAAVCIGMVKREAGGNGSSESRRQACTMTLRRLLRPALLRGIAQLLPRK